MVAQDRGAIAQKIFSSGGEMGALMRSYDWATTPFGPVEGWPQSLRSALSICLNSRFPIAIYWGPDRLLLYNDAWRPIVGDKHPGSLGRPGREVWPEIWNDIGPEFESVFATGEGIFHSDELLAMHRYGYTEECFFEYTFNPIQGEGGGVDGIFNVVSETTYRVLSDRRAKLLREVASRTGIARTSEDAYRLIAEALRADPADIPLFLFYRMDAEGLFVYLCDGGPLPLDESIAPGKVVLEATDSTGWPISRCVQTAQAQEIDDLVLRFGELPGSPWPEPPQEAMVLPIALAGQTQVFGVLVAVASPRRRLDDYYRDFFEQIARHTATAIANARSYEAERQRAEELAELDRAKTVFFSNVSHEFRTPLTLMLGPVEEALQQAQDTAQRDRLELIHRNALRLQKLVNTLLDFARIEAGRIEALYEPTDLAELTRDLAGVFRSASDRAGLRLRVDCPPLPEAIYVDRDMWEKIVLNLLSNAFKFTFEGEIHVSLHLEENSHEQGDQALAWQRWKAEGRGQEAEGIPVYPSTHPPIHSPTPSPLPPHVILKVQDTGTGIPAADLPHIFERFHRVQGAQGRTYEGSGIGLALVQELVRLHGGTITASSVVGEGTTFTVAIPTGWTHLPSDRLRHPEGDRQPSVPATRMLTSTATGTTSYVEEAMRWLPEAAQEQESRGEREGGWSPDEAPHSPESARPKILLADDNADMRGYVQRLLSQQYRVETVADGAAALAAIQERLPDLVLTDVMMPGVDGFELLRQLRGDPQTQELPIILLSARAGEEARMEGLEAGADDYLTKPFSARELVVRIEATLKLAQMRRDVIRYEQAARLEAEAAREKVSLILESITDAFVAFDREWHYTYVNEQAAQLLHKTREELVGKQVWEEVFPDRVGTHSYQQLHRALDEQVAVVYEDFNPLLGIWFEVHAYPSSEGLAVYFQNISDRRRIDLMVREQTRLLELIASGTPLDECLAAICQSVSTLNPRIKACFLLSNAEGTAFPRSITPDLPPSFGAGLKDAPINELCIGTCGEAVYSGQAIICADIAQDERWSQGWRDLCIAHGIFACYSNPVLGTDNRPLGSLMLGFEEARMPSEWECKLSDFGTQIASIAFERDRTTLALVESEHRYRTLFDSIDEGFGICEMLFDENGEGIDYRFLNVNPAFQKLTGWQNPIGRTVRELLPNVEPFWIETYSRLVQTGDPIRFEQESVAMGRWFDVNAFAIGDRQSNRFAMLFTDITERKRVEQERERFLAVGSDLLVITGNNGHFQWVSPTFERILGWTVEDMIAHPWTDFVHPDDVPKSIAETADLFSGNETIAFENRYRCKDGSYRWFLWNAQPYPQEGVIYGAAVDITERRQVEEILRQRETDLRLVTDAIPALISFVDTDQRYRFNNRGYEEWFERSASDISGKHLREVMGDAAYEGIRPYVEQVLAGQPITFERLMLLHGQPRYVSATYVPQFDPKGTVAGFVALVSEITDRKRAEQEREQLLARERAARAEAEQANRIKDEFLAIVSHELRSPLNPILGWSTLLQNNTLDASKTAQALATIQRNARLQSELIEDLLDISRILRGKLSLSVAPVKLVETVRAAMETVRLAAEAKSIQLVAQLEPDAGTISGDATRLQQVVWNLLSNAVKFTPNGGQVKVHLGREGTHACITVSDNGQGIAADFLPYVFDYFRQADGATTRKFGGLGLGLAIVRHLVELHGGTITAESPGNGLGATFRVKLPLMVRPAQPLPDSSPSETALDLTGIRVLMVDDDSDTREFVGFLLEQYGATVTVAASADEAFVALTQQTPDILLSDIGMPDVDGYMLMQRVRSLPQEQGGGIPAIALTAYAGEIDYQHAMAVGFQRHIAKPIEPAMLIETMLSLVNQRGQP